MTLSMHDVAKFVIEYGDSGWQAGMEIDSDDHGHRWLSLGSHPSVGEATEAVKEIAMHLQGEPSMSAAAAVAQALGEDEA